VNNAKGSEREIHKQNSRIPPIGHTRRSSRNGPSIGPGMTEYSRLLPLSTSNVDRDRERERDRERMLAPFVIPPSPATQAHVSTTLDAVPKVRRVARDVRERREPITHFGLAPYLPSTSPFRYFCDLFPCFFRRLSRPNRPGSITFLFFFLLFQSDEYRATDDN